MAKCMNSSGAKYPHHKPNIIKLMNLTKIGIALFSLNIDNELIHISILTGKGRPNNPKAILAILL